MTYPLTGQFGATIVEGAGAFGDVITGEINPLLQREFSAGGHEDEVFESSAGGGAVSYADSMALVTSGGSVGGYAMVRSDRACRYRPGQGAVYRFTALFDSPTAGVRQVAGCFAGVENALLVGYNDADTGGPGGAPRFGVCRQYNGRREIQQLAISVGAGGAEDVTLTLNGAATVIAVTAGTAAEVAQQIAEEAIDGWVLEADGAAVNIMADAAEPRAGSYSVSSTGTVTGTFSQKRAGKPVEEEWAYIGEFNVLPLDGSRKVVGDFELDPAVLNPYQIRMQYLGGGAIDFGVENPQTGRFALFHRFRSGRYTSPSVSNPIFTVGIAVENVSSGTSKTVKTASLMGAVEGPFNVLGPDHGVDVSTSISGAGTAFPVASIRSSAIYVDGQSRANLRDLLPTLLAASGSGGNKQVKVRLVLNGTLTDPLWTSYATAHSYAAIDTSATAISGGDVLLATSFTASGGSTGAINLRNIEISIRPGDILSVVLEPTGTNAVDVDASISWKEDS